MTTPVRSARLLTAVLMASAILGGCSNAMPTSGQVDQSDPWERTGKTLGQGAAPAKAAPVAAPAMAPPAPAAVPKP
ncbi:MAG: hypothetical protein ABL907_03265 [Hyphomicrobium sp.]